LACPPHAREATGGAEATLPAALATDDVEYRSQGGDIADDVDLAGHGPACRAGVRRCYRIAFAGRVGTREPQNEVLATGQVRITPKLVDMSNLDENNALLGKADRRRVFALGNQLWDTVRRSNARPQPIRC
jgi:hypothetical protein